LARAYFPEHSLEARNIRRALTNEFPPWVLLAAKLESQRSGSGDEAAVDGLAASVYRDPSLRNRVYHLVYKLTPRYAFAAAQAVNRRVVLRLRGISLKTATADLPGP
jgi:hypothetical protein